MKRVYILTLGISLLVIITSAEAQNFFPVSKGDKYLANLYEIEGFCGTPTNILDSCTVTSTLINNKEYLNYWGRLYRFDTTENKLYIRIIDLDRLAVDFNRTSGSDTVWYDDNCHIYSYSLRDTLLAGRTRKLLELYYYEPVIPYPGYPFPEGSYVHKYKFVEDIGEVEAYELDDYYQPYPSYSYFYEGHRSLLKIEKEDSTILVYTSPPVTVNIPNEQRIVFTWADKTLFETGYQVEKKDISDPYFNVIAILPANSTICFDSNFVYGQSYQYRVRSFRDNIFAYSDTLFVNAIVQPSYLTASTSGFLRIFLEWEYNSTLCDHFIVEKSVKLNNLWEDFQIIDTLEVNQLSYLDTLVNAGDYYRYRVRAIYQNILSIPSNIISASPDFILLSPEQFNVEINDYEAVRLTWRDPNIYTGTKFTVGRKLSITSTYVILSTGKVDTFYIDEGIEPGKTYKYRVQAKLGPKSSTYTYSDELFIPPFIPVVPPQGVRGDSTIQGTVIVSWSDQSSNEKEFEIGRGKTPESIVKIGSVPLNIETFEDTSPILYGTDKEHYYAVRGVNPHSQSDWTITQILTSVNENLLYSYTYSLYQNYPNPFNPSTKIKYSSASKNHLKLIVYDILGNEVTRLLDEEKNAGNYEIEFNSGSLASGIYFCKYTSAGGFNAVIKLILLK